MRRKIVITLLLVVSAFSIFYLWSNDKNLKNKMILSNSSYLEDIDIIHNVSGVIKWKLISKKAYFINDSVIKLSVVHMIFPDDGFSIKSDTGLYNLEIKDMVFEGNIKVASKNYDILTDKLLFNYSQKKLFSDEDVQIIGKRFIIKGRGLIVDADKAILNKNVRATFYVK